MDEKTQEEMGKNPFRMTIDRIVGVFLFGLSAYVIIYSYVSLPLGTHSNPGPGYLPMLLGIVIAILALIILAQGRRAPAFRDLNWPGFSHSVGIVACCIFAILAMESLGYRITMLLILLFLFGVLERLKIWLALILSGVLTLGTYGLFHNLLNVPLPIGVLGF
jgi:putative tricarboxylic transport membrane protein